jgi:predicted metal-dependent hydrolase
MDRSAADELTHSLRAGIAVFNEGGHHEAHDAWEGYWLGLDRGSDDERFLHGLIQFTAAVHHAHGQNWGGTTGLARSGRDYLTALPPTHRGVNVDDVRAYLSRLAADPELAEREPPLRLRHEGVALTYDDLELPAATVVAEVVAEEAAPYDEEVVERATRYARSDLDDGAANSPFVSLLLDFALDPAQRAMAYQRLAEHVQRRAAREADVEGLFD